MSENQNRINSFFKSSGFLLCALMLLFLICFYSPLLFHLNTVIFSDKGDALKNYFAYNWHIHIDEGYSEYSGTNYPYGELFIYTDGNPLLAGLVKTLPFLKPYSIAIYNISLLLSFVLCAYFLLKIFREFELDNAVSILAAFGITVLCPQALRLTGHISLAYNFILPLIIYLVLLYQKHPGWKYSTFISISLLCSFLIHPYMGMIGASFVALCFAGKMIWEFKQIKKMILPLLVQCALPVGFFFFLVKLSDTHQGRPLEPYGFLVYDASPQSVLISYAGLSNKLASYIKSIPQPNWEGIAYIGITTILAFMFLPIFLMKHWNRFKDIFNSNPNQQNLFIMLCSSSALLILSTGYPFKWNLEHLLDSISIIKQFRAIGRFAWIFYFVSTICATVLIAKYYRGLFTGTKERIAVLLVISLFFLEGIPYHIISPKEFFPKNPFKKELLDKDLSEVIAHIKPDLAQGIIPLPFYHEGTDFFVIPGTVKSRNAGYISAYHSQTPVMANVTCRTAMRESENLIGILGTELHKKEIRSDLVSDKPFYVLWTKENLKPEEESLFEKAESVFENNAYVLKLISKENLLADKRTEKIKFFNTKRPSLFRKGDFYLSDSARYFSVQTFDSLPGQLFKGEVSENNVILNIPANTLHKDKTYELSFHYITANEKGVDNDLYIIQRLNNKDSVIVKQNVREITNIKMPEIIGVVRFKAIRSDASYIIKFKGGLFNPDLFSLDNVMLREKDLDVYKEIPSSKDQPEALMVNNFVIPF